MSDLFTGDFLLVSASMYGTNTFESHYGRNMSIGSKNSRQSTSRMIYVDILG